jgi:tight adherence protein B
MNWDPLYVAYAGVLVATLFLVEGLYFLYVDLQGGDRKAANRRMRLLASGLEGEEVYLQLRRQRGEVGLAAMLRLDWLGTMLRNAGAPITTSRMGVLMLAAAVMITALMSGLGRASLVKGLSFGVGLGIGLPILVLSYVGRRRIRKFTAQLPDALDMMVRSLRAGHPISASMGLIAREMSDPIGSDFGLVFDETTYGLELSEALENLSRRYQITDLRFMVVAIKVQLGTGGNLAEILAALSRVIRDRQRMDLKVRALSAEGRFSAYVLSVLPFAVMGGMLLINPGYFAEAAPEPVFKILIGAALSGILTGIVIMYRMVNFRI